VRAGKAELVLSEAGDDWRYQWLEDGRERSAGDVDPAALTDWWKSLHSVSAESFMPTGAAPLREAGPGATTLRISFERSKGKQAFEVRFGRHEAGRVAVTRMDAEPFTLWFPERALDLVSVSTARFRQARLLDEVEGTFSSMRVTRSTGASETVTKDAKGYRFDAPAAVGVERASVDEIVRLFSALEAVRFVADAPSAEHGLAAPDTTLRVEYSPAAGRPRVHTLKLGAATEGGRFAQIDESAAVFVAPEPLVSQLREPLASRSSLATPIEALTSLTIEHGSTMVTVERKGGRWVIAGAAGGAVQRAETLARALATLRVAHVTQYGKPEAGEGMAHPVARLHVVISDGAGSHRQEITFGSPVTAEPRSDVYARRTDLDVGFVVGRDALDTLLEVTQAVAPP
jgi:hypothetical protein